MVSSLVPYLMSTIVFTAYILIKGDLKSDKGYLVLMFFDLLAFPIKITAIRLGSYLFALAS